MPWPNVVAQILTRGERCVVHHILECVRDLVDSGPHSLRGPLEVAEIKLNRIVSHGLKPLAHASYASAKFSIIAASARAFSTGTRMISGSSPPPCMSAIALPS